MCQQDFVLLDDVCVPGPPGSPGSPLCPIGPACPFSATDRPGSPLAPAFRETDGFKKRFYNTEEQKTSLDVYYLN